MRILAGFAFLLALGALFTWIASSVPRNPHWTEPQSGIPIMIETNGFHTGIVLPVVTDIKDWRETFPSALRITPSGPVTHIAVGWGEKEIFLNTPQWSDLRLSTVVRIALKGGDGLLRIHHYVRPAPDEYHREVHLRPHEYRQLVAQIEAALTPPGTDGSRRTYIGFDPTSVNYDATGRYTLGRTCNQWTADTLAASGVKIGWWTPFEGGVMKWFPFEEQ